MSLLRNCFRIVWFCLLITFFLSVYLFVLMYPTVCLCGVITRSYLWLLLIKRCSIIVRLFPKLSFDIKFRMMMNARSY